MFCIYCGKKVVDYARYCNHCGQFIGNTIISGNDFDPEDNMTVDVYAPVELLEDLDDFDSEDDKGDNIIFSYGTVPRDTAFTSNNDNTDCRNNLS